MYWLLLCLWFVSAMLSHAHYCSSCEGPLFDYFRSELIFRDIGLFRLPLYQQVCSPGVCQLRVIDWVSAPYTTYRFSWNINLIYNLQVQLEYQSDLQPTCSAGISIWSTTYRFSWTINLIYNLQVQLEYQSDLQPIGSAGWSAWSTTYRFSWVISPVHNLQVQVGHAISSIHNLQVDH